MTPGGPRREPRDGARPQRADPRADRRAATPTRSEFLAKHGRFFPGARTLRRHHRPARPADGRDAVADALDDARAARRARVDDRRAAARRPTAWSTSPSSPRTWTCCCPAASATAYRSRATSRSGSKARSSRSPGSRRWTRWRTRCRDVDSPADLAGDRSGRGPRPARRRRACATSTRSTTSLAGSRRPAT